MEDRLEILRRMDLKALVGRLEKVRDEALKASMDLLGFESDNRGHLHRGVGDSEAVKEREAVLLLEAPTVQETGRPTTQVQKEAWLVGQRRSDELLAATLKKQADVSYERAHLAAVLEDTIREHGDIRALLALRTAQLNFLKGE